MKSIEEYKTTRQSKYNGMKSGFLVSWTGKESEEFIDFINSININKHTNTNDYVFAHTVESQKVREWGGRKII